MGRRQLARLGVPVAFLLAVTVAVLLVRASLERGGGGGGASTLGSATSLSTSGGAGTRTRASATGNGATGSARRYYTVQKGDTFGSIAAREGTTIAKLEALNPKANPTTLQVGQRIRVR